MTEAVAGIIYYITFQASLPDDENAKTFQAKVLVKFPDPTNETDMVRKIKNVKKMKMVTRIVRVDPPDSSASSSVSSG